MTEARRSTEITLHPPVAFGRPEPRGSARQGQWDLFGVILVFATLALYAYGGFVAGLPTLPGIVVMPILLLVVSPLMRRAQQQEERFDLAGILLVSFALQMAGAYLRLAGAADALEYHQVGSELADHFRQLDFFVPPGRDFPGTGFIRYLTGLVEVLTGSTIFPTFLIFSAGAFIGFYGFYRALETAFPQADLRRYAMLLFLWPSLRFWPSSIGKEAWMVLSVGLISWGAAKVFVHRRGGMLLLALGLVGGAMIRPHVSMVALLAVFVALLFRRSAQLSLRRLVGKVALVLVLLVAGTILASETAEFLDIEGLGSGGVSQAFESTVGRTEQGGSAFTPPEVRNPFDYPWAIVTVLVRPFPNEADSTEMLLSALEGLMLVGITIGSWARLARVPRLMLREPYLVYATAYVLSFTFAFSVIGNFGILVRQRTQVLPLVFVLLAVPMALEPRERRAHPPETSTSANRSSPATRLPFTSTASPGPIGPMSSTAPSRSETCSTPPP